MQVRSPSGTSSPGTGSVDLPTGRLSPVSAASSISSVAARRTRPSAGTRLPASTSTTSPGTRSPASISTAWPSRRTRAIVFIICASALTLSSALDSWRRPMTALNTVSRPGRPWCRLAGDELVDQRPRTSRTTCMKSSYCRRNARQAGSFLPAASRFGPWEASRCAASSAESRWRGRRRARATGCRRGDRVPSWLDSRQISVLVVIGPPRMRACCAPDTCEDIGETFENCTAPAVSLSPASGRGRAAEPSASLPWRR